MKIDVDIITPHIARQVLWHFMCEGYKPGSFIQALILAIASADPLNRYKLSLGFPEYVAAVALAQDRDDGIDVLRGIAEVGSTPGGGGA